METKYYKFLQEDFTAKYSRFSYKSYLPQKNGKYGKWLPYVEKILLCASGYHACGPYALSEWISYHLYEVEFKGKNEPSHRTFSKVVGHRIRLTRKIEEWNELTALRFVYWLANECYESRKSWMEFDGDQEVLSHIKEKSKNPDYHIPESILNTARFEHKVHPYNYIAAVFVYAISKKWYDKVGYTIAHARPSVPYSKTSAMLKQMLEI